LIGKTKLEIDLLENFITRVLIFNDFLNDINTFSTYNVSIILSYMTIYVTTLHKLLLNMCGEATQINKYSREANVGQ